MKRLKWMNGERRKLILISVLVALPIIAMITLSLLSTIYKERQTEPVDSEISVTSEEIAEYKSRIGSDLDVKKAILIIFNTEDECKQFIDAYGGHSDVLSLGMGILPQMQDDEDGKYYNVVGNGIFEPLFDSLGDGEHSKEPIEFGGMYCYFKRLQTDRFADDEEGLRKMIINEKGVVQDEKSD